MLMLLLTEMTTEVAQANSLTSLSLMSKGLVTTVFGLLGVFVVLALFFVTIKLMQRIKTRDDKQD